MYNVHDRAGHDKFAYTCTQLCCCYQSVARLATIWSAIIPSSRLTSVFNNNSNNNNAEVINLLPGWPLSGLQSYHHQGLLQFLIIIVIIIMLKLSRAVKFSVLKYL